MEFFDVYLAFALPEAVVILAMAMPFAYSIRALQADREWPAAAVLASAVVLLGLWLVWFFWAPLVRYDSGAVAGVTRGGALIAVFPRQAQADLRSGQLALVRPTEGQSGAEAFSPAPAMVTAVESTEDGTQVVAELAPLSARWFGRNQGGGAAVPLTVDVEVERLSPAQWIWRASGQWIDTAAVMLRPQAR